MFHITESMQAYWNKRGKPKATATKIAFIETAVGSKLAMPYIEFVTQFGFVSFDDVVGVEMRCLFDYTIVFSDRKEIREGDIGSFLLPNELIETYEYFTTAEFEGDETSPLLPRNYLPIANDAGQGKVLIELGENAGRVWYWSEKEWAWGTEDNTWLGFVADDFYEFIKKLHS